MKAVAIGRPRRTRLVCLTDPGGADQYDSDEKRAHPLCLPAQSEYPGVSRWRARRCVLERCRIGREELVDRSE
jgi:hypothetical protein